MRMIRKLAMCLILVLALTGNAWGVLKNTSYGGDIYFYDKEAIVNSAGVPQADSIVVPIAVTSDRLWGVLATDRSVVLTKTPGASSWVRANAGAGTSILYAWPTSTGAVLYNSGGDNVIRRMTWTSNNNISKTTVLTMTSAGRGFWYTMADHNGTLILVEYGGQAGTATSHSRKLTTDVNIFTPSMVTDGTRVTFTTSGNQYTITGYTSAKEVTLSDDSSVEGSNHAFRVGNPTIYRSTDDGNNWTPVFDFSGQVLHIHCIAYHPGTGQWILNTGDGAGLRAIVTSSDDGLNWDFVQFSPGINYSSPFQAVQFVDYGHPTKMLVMSDSAALCFSYDLVTHAVENIVDDNDRRAIHDYGWSGFKASNGILYASGYTTGTPSMTNNVLTIYGGNDPSNMRPVGTYYENIGGLMFLGEFDGNLEMAAGGRYSNLNEPGHAKMTVNRVELQTSEMAFVYPAVTNWYGAADSTCTGVTIDPTYYYTHWKKWTGTQLTEETSGGIGNSHCVKLTGTSQGDGKANLELRTPILNVGNGATVSCSAWVKGTPGTITVTLLSGSSTDAVSTEYSTTESDGFSRMDWFEVNIPAATINSTHRYVRMRIRLVPFTPKYASAALYVDNPQIVTGASVGPWTIGGVAGEYVLFGDTISPVNGKLDDTVCFVPAISSYELAAFAATKFYVKSWTSGATSAKLYWDVLNSCWAIDLTNGSESETITSPATGWCTGQPIWFSFHVSGEPDYMASAAFNMGSGVGTFTNPVYGYPQFTTSAVNWQYADPDHTTGIYGWLGGGTGIEVKRPPIHVSVNGNDMNDGLSWTNAKRTVNSGLTAAVSGDQVWVAKGSYAERITLKNGVGLYGGFAGNESLLTERPDFPRPAPDLNETILDGSQAGSVVTSPSGAMPNTHIDGFTIRNGNASSGGGIYCDFNTASTIRNNTIVGNNAYYGGGMFCSNSSSTIMYNTIAGNLAHSDGGGIYCYSSSLLIFNNVIAENTVSSGGGGGILCVEGAWPLISNNTIVRNNAVDGGGILCYMSYPTIANTIIAFNSSGIYAYGGPWLEYNCVFGNTDYDYSGIDDPTGWDGNISLDPFFVNHQGGDYRLRPGSRCIDAGSNGDVPPDTYDLNGNGNIYESTPFDLGGGLRFIDDPSAPDTGGGISPIVDIGAYESGPTSFFVCYAPLMDANGDLHVDSIDFDTFSACYNGPTHRVVNACLCMDANGDQYVDAVDFDAFSGCYNGPTNPPGCN